MRRRQVSMYWGWVLIVVGVAFIMYGLVASRQNKTFLIFDTVFGAICLAYGLLRLWEAHRGRAFLAIRFPAIPPPHTRPGTALRMALIAVAGAAITLLFYVWDEAIYHSQAVALMNAILFAGLTVVAVGAQPFRYRRWKRERV